MDVDSTGQGQPVSLSVLSTEDQALVADAVAHFETLSKDAGYDVDPLRMAFASMGIAALIRQDQTPDQCLKKIRSIREVAELMGVETSAVTRKDISTEPGDIIDAINPKLEGLLEAIERGNDAAADEHSGAGATPPAYQAM